MSDYIYHYGIKGQKWGVRRYQNPDGTLTSMGKARKRAIDVNRNMDAVNDIVKTMSRKDKELLNLDGDVYQQSAEDGGASVKNKLMMQEVLPRLCSRAGFLLSSFKTV